MVLLILLLLITVVVIGFLLLPMELYVDTAKNQYYFTFRGLAKMWLESDPTEILKIGLKVFFYTHYFYPLRKKKKTKQLKKRNKKRKRWPIGQIWALLRTFKLKRFWLDVDTGDCILNAKLYPLFSFASFYGLPCHINYNDTNRMVLQVQNRPIDLLKSFINYKTQHHGFTF
ncbi:hypothetical protein [uncultured Croceitalea sp.]|uniref:hypothetical protein n=1 Tax=uncultured Croceitalea sp. TaxID=1798908 RepID=UPI003305A83B